VNLLSAKEKRASEKHVVVIAIIIAPAVIFVIVVVIVALARATLSHSLAIIFFAANKAKENE
jgi:cytochrome c oxidase subunit IV